MAGVACQCARPFVCRRPSFDWWLGSARRLETRQPRYFGTGDVGAATVFDRVQAPQANVVKDCPARDTQVRSSFLWRVPLRRIEWRESRTGFHRHAATDAARASSAHSPEVFTTARTTLSRHAGRPLGSRSGGCSRLACTQLSIVRVETPKCRATAGFVR